MVFDTRGRGGLEPHRWEAVGRVPTCVGTGNRILLMWVLLGGLYLRQLQRHSETHYRNRETDYGGECDGRQSKYHAYRMSVELMHDPVSQPPLFANQGCCEKKQDCRTAAQHARTVYVELVDIDLVDHADCSISR